MLTTTPLVANFKSDAFKLDKVTLMGDDTRPKKAVVNGQEVQVQFDDQSNPFVAELALDLNKVNTITFS